MTHNAPRVPVLLLRRNEQARPETHVALVTHNDFLTALLHDAPDFLAVAPDLRVHFGNADHHATVLEWD